MQVTIIIGHSSREDFSLFEIFKKYTKGVVPDAMMDSCSSFLKAEIDDASVDLLKSELDKVCILEEDSQSGITFIMR